MSAGRAIEIYKEALEPDRVRRALRVGGAARAATRSGTPGWRPRAASRPKARTRSRPGWTSASSTTARSPTTTACAVRCAARAIAIQTENDSEVAAGYLTWRMREGATLEQALEGCLDDLDGFFTFAVGTADGFAVLRDPIACKPAVMAETDDWVAMASEYRALAVLPGADDAEVWEPEPGRVYRMGAAHGRPQAESRWWCAGPDTPQRWPRERGRGRRRRRDVRPRRRRAARPQRAPARRRRPALLAASSTPAGATASRSGSTPSSTSRSPATSATTAPA